MGDQKRQKQKFVLISGLSGFCFHPLSWWRWWCPPIAGGAGCRASGGLSWCVFPLPLSAFLLCPRCVGFEICLYSRSKGVFRGFPLLDVGLYCSGALRGLWGFCVREWLGGLKACGVFASVFLVFPLLCLPFHLFTCFLSFTLSALFWLSFACPLALSLWLFGRGCCFLFPFGLHAKRKGAPCWCVLSWCVVGLFICSVPP